MTQSELFTIMVSGMAHVSGAVMAAYVMFAHVEIQHLLTAVIMTAPATIMLAKILEPETETPVTAGKVEVQTRKHFASTSSTPPRTARATACIWC